MKNLLLKTNFMKLELIYKDNALFQVRQEKDKEVHSIIRGGILEECIAYVEGVYGRKVEETKDDKG